jgi:hypothetical protein
MLIFSLLKSQLQISKKPQLHALGFMWRLCIAKNGFATVLPSFRSFLFNKFLKALVGYEILFGFCGKRAPEKKAY